MYKIEDRKGYRFGWLMVVEHYGTIIIKRKHKIEYITGPKRKLSY